MKAIISGQAGVAILIEGERFSVLRVGQELAEPCNPGEVLWYLADARDTVEAEAAGAEDAAAKLKAAWMSDRALQSALILLDRSETTEIRQDAATLLNASLEQPVVSDFVLNHLYSLRHIEQADFDGALRQVHSTADNIRSLLGEVRDHQDAIRSSRDEWDGLPAVLFETAGRERKGVSADPGSAKQILEAWLTSSGCFRWFAKALQRGVRPDEDSEFLQCTSNAEPTALENVVNAVIEKWTEAAVPAGRAMVGMHLLAPADVLRAQRYAETLVTSMGERARERGVQQLMVEAVKNTSRSGAGEADVGRRLLEAVREVAHSWLTEMGTDSGSLLNIWDAVYNLPATDLNRLMSFARIKVRELGSKAHGREAKDLLQEAITSTASGQRTWREGIDLRQHLYGAMRSIASSWYEKIGEEFIESDLIEPGGTSPLERESTEINPERILEAKERLEHIRRLFQKDAEARRILDLMGEEYSAQEIQKQLGLKRNTYEAAVKRIRRRLAASA